MLFAERLRNLKPGGWVLFDELMILMCVSFVEQLAEPSQSVRSSWYKAEGDGATADGCRSIFRALDVGCLGGGDLLLLYRSIVK